MAPGRGTTKRRNAKGRVDEGGSTSSSLGDVTIEDWWAEFSKRISGTPSTSGGLGSFDSVFKISRKTFEHICWLVKNDMKGTHKFKDGKPLCLHDQVAVAMRRLGSGDSFSSIGDSFGLNHSAVSGLTWNFVEAMESKSRLHLHWPSTEAEMAEIKSGFESIRGLPNCCGVIDVTHISLHFPASVHDKEMWLDSKHSYSMVLQAILDHKMRFRDVVTGWPGVMDEQSIFRSSRFYERCNRGERLNGNKIEGSEIREYIIGDSGYPLLPYIVTPYVGKGLSESKADFNKRHSATRMAAHRALAKLKDSWKIIHEVWKPDRDKLPRIIFVCCLLHNICIDLEDEVQDKVQCSHRHDLGYRQKICEEVDAEGEQLRERLCVYLSGQL